jgi:hypothetical protein
METILQAANTMSDATAYLLLGAVLTFIGLKRRRPSPSR